MKKSDIVLALIIGEITAWYFKYLLKDLEAVSSFLWTLPIVFPILTVICLWIAYLIGRKLLFVFQLAKFMLIGVLATIIDLGILGFLIWVTGITGGLAYSIFKGISFLVATVSKYWGDKVWAFEKKETTGVGKEFIKFFLVTLGGLLINVGTASLVVNVIGSQFGFSAELWANIGGIIAAFATVLWNFVGYKFLVFKK
jgi:putative flippase GtrA